MRIVAAEPRLLISVAAMGALYVSAIRREEAELLLREDLPEYSQYRARTGCFLPRWVARTKHGIVGH